MNEQIDALADAAEEMVKISPAALAIHRMAADETAGLPDLVKLIESEASFTIQLLRLANSPHYLRGEPTASIAHAITLIGRRELGSMAFVCACTDGMQSMESSALKLKDLWREGMILGSIARELSAVVPEAREYAFAAGMLHSIGTVVLHSQLPEKVREAVKLSIELDMRLYEAEQQVFGFTHADLGAALARRWHLPEPLVTAIEFQHNPDKAPKHRAVTAVLAIASLALNQTMQLDEFGDDMDALDSMLENVEFTEVFSDTGFDLGKVTENAIAATFEAA